MRYIIFFVIFSQLVFADCLFRVANYSLQPIKVQAGFYRGESTIFTVSNSETNSKVVKADYECFTNGADGNGVVYIKIIGCTPNGNNLNGCGWVYSPQSSIIRAYGASTKNSDFVMGAVKNNKFTLYNNYKPESDSFDVQIKPAQFRGTANGSSN